MLRETKRAQKNTGRVIMVLTMTRVDKDTVQMGTDLEERFYRTCFGS